MKKNFMVKTVTTALAAAMVATSFAAPALAETTTKSGTGLVQKFTYNVTVDATLNEDGAITAIAYDKNQTFGDQNLVYAEAAMDGIQEQIAAKSSITSVNDVDTVSSATLSSNAIKQAIAEITGEEFDLTAANGSLVMGKNGEVGLEDAMKKAVNFLGLSSLEKDADGNYITTGKSEAWLTYYGLYQQGAALMTDDTATAYDKAIVEAKMNDALLALKAETGSDRGGAGSGGSGERTQAGDSTALTALVDQAKALTEADYTAESWKLLQDELTEAESLIAMGRAPQTSLDTQQADLQAAIDALVKVAVTEDKKDNSTTTPAVTTPAKAKKQTIKVTVKTKSVKAAALKKAKKTVTAITVKNAKTKLSYKKVSGSKKLTVNSTTGKITVKKGTKKGTYSIKVKVTAKASAAYQAAGKTVTVKVKVK